MCNICGYHTVFSVATLHRASTWDANNTCFFAGDNKHADGILALCQICVYANSASNPLIYNAVNGQFREGFKNYFRSWIECVLKIKGRQRTEQVRLNNRRKPAKDRGGCTMCRTSDTSVNGALCNNSEPKVNNNHRVDMETKLAHDTSQENEELLTAV